MGGMDFALYLNIFFAALIGLGMLVGLLRGMKKSLYALVVKLMFYIFFFATLGVMVGIIWTAPMPFLGGVLAGVDPALSQVGSLSEALPILIESMLGDNLEASLTNQEFLDFAAALGMFVVKLVYTLLYFTVFKLVWSFIFFIVRIIFFRDKKDAKFKGKKRLVGAGIGGLSGALSIYVFLILFGGIMNITESFLAVLDTGSDAEELSYEQSSPLNNGGFDVPAELEDDLAMLQDAVSAYNSNPIVAFMQRLKVEDEDTGRETELTMVLFDSVFSIDYRDTKIALRNEIAIFSEIIGIAVGSEYINSGEVSDLKGTEVRDVFNALSASDLFAVIIPLAIEVGTDYLDTEISIDRDELYAIDWNHEIAQLGEIAATAFDILEAAGVFDEQSEYETHVFDGDDFRTLFNNISDSNLITLTAYTAMEPLIDNMSEDMSAVLALPEDIVWENEFRAFGEIIGSILDTEITVGELREQDYNVIMTKFSTMRFEVLLESKIVSQAMINVMSGAMDVEGFDDILVPDDVVWLDDFAYDAENIPQEDKGELRKILEALNAIADKANDIDLDDIDINLLITEFDGALVETVLESRVLASTLGAFVYEMSQDQDVLAIPQSVLETVMVKETDRTIVMKSEIITMVETIQLLNITDFENGFSASILDGLADEDIDKLFDSKIIHATISKLLLDMLGEDAFLVVPYFDEAGDDGSSESRIRYFDQDDQLEYISVSELSSVLRGFLALDITDDFDNLENIDLNLINENIDTLLDSAILHATVSKQLFDLGDDFIVIPFYAEDDVEMIRITVGENDEETVYVSKSELKNTLNALEALDVLDIDDFEGGFSLEALEDPDKRAAVLASSILQATVSKTLIEMSDVDGIIAVPHYENDPTEETLVRRTVGENDEATEYILKDELDKLFDALVILGLTEDIDNFDGSLDLSVLEDTTKRADILASFIMQATLSKQLIEMADDNDVLVVPHYKDDQVTLTPLRLTIGSGDKESSYIDRTEIDDMVNALVVLGLTENIDAFDGAVNLDALEDDTQRGEVLASHIMRATITKQLLDMQEDNDVLVVPYLKDNPDEDEYIRIEVTDGTHATTYIILEELDALINALVILGLTDNLDAFDGGVNLDALGDETNRQEVLASSIMQATITKQLLNMEIDEDDPLDTGVIKVPYLKDNPDEDDYIRRTIGSGGEATEYIIFDELDALIHGLFILGLADDLENFDGGIDLAAMEIAANRSVVLSSSIMQATITKQLLDMQEDNDILVVPYQENNTGEDVLVRRTIGSGAEETEYVTADELDRLLVALVALELTENLDTFDGGVDLSILSDDLKRADVLASHIMQATISQQLFDLETDQDVLVVPYHKDDVGETVIRYTLETSGLESHYVNEDELDKFITGLVLLGLADNIDQYGGDIDLDVLKDETNRADILASSILQATFSKQIIDNSDKPENPLLVPILAADDATLVRRTVGSGAETTEYITRDELDALIDAMDILGISENIENFDGNVNLIVLQDDTNRANVLSSSIIQATISEQVIEMDEDPLQGTVKVPFRDQDDTLFIRFTTGDGTDYIDADELDALINAVILLSVDETAVTFYIDDFDGSVKLEVLEDATKRLEVLSSSVIQATISDQMFDLETGGTIVIPDSDSDDTRNIAITITSGVDDESHYIRRVELDYFIDALLILGLDDVQNYDGSFEMALLETEANQDDLLLSAIMHATISKSIDDLDDSVLLMPDATKDTVNAHMFVTKTEIKSLIDAFVIMGFADVDSATTIDPTLFEEEDVDTLLASQAIQATISDLLLSHAQNELDTSDLNKLIVPSALRESVMIGGLSEEQIEKVELSALLKGLLLLDVADFEGNMDASVITNLVDPNDEDDENLNTLLASDSIYVTIDNMMEQNAYISANTPDLAIEGTVHGITDVRTREEIKAFLKAADTLGQDFASVSINLSTLNTLNENEQDTILSTMIVRNALTDEIEAEIQTQTGTSPGDPGYPIDESYYEENDYDNFLTKAGIEYYLDNIAS